VNGFHSTVTVQFVQSSSNINLIKWCGRDKLGAVSYRPSFDYIDELEDVIEAVCNSFEKAYNLL
jgi:hypothetical protein